MDKRGWPWRKKSSEKMSSSFDSVESSPAHSARQLDDHEVSRILADHMRTPDDSTTQLQQPEEKLKHLSERLVVALSDVSAKDDLAKQHAKVAEEAVSGWEKAEAEAAMLRQQLDAAIQQKLATEDRVSHLDGALKECMRQLRHAREEQEQRIHDAVVKKTRDWDKVRSELEEKLADIGQQLMEAIAKNAAMSKSLQEQSKTISDMSEVQSQAESEIKMLQNRLDSVEKENAAFRYEIHVLNKELEIRNEEREISKRSADVASRQHHENIKKMGKLEAECQRLRSLVRKKLPGPAAVAQMKFEVEALGKDKGESYNRRKSAGGKGVGSPKAAFSETMQEFVQELGAKDAEVLTKRLHAMDEETKMLKEVLAKRNNELQTARLMCARTASKLSNVEEQLHTLLRSQGLSKYSGRTGLDIHLEASRSLSVGQEPSLTSMSEDGNDDELSCAESWASALIAELAQFKKETVTNNHKNRSDASNLDLIDDFIEIERLASISPSKVNSTIPELEKSSGCAGRSVRKEIGGEIDISLERDKIALEQMLAHREAELKAANEMCKEVSSKLALAEEQLAFLQSKYAENESTLVSLQGKLNMIFEAHEEGANIEKVVEDIKSTLGIPCNSVARLRAHIRRLSKGSHPGDVSSNKPPECNELANQSCMSASADSSSEEEVLSSMSDVDSKACGVTPELTSAVCKVVCLVEDLAVAITAYQFSNFPHRESRHDSFSNVDTCNKDRRIASGMQCKTFEVDNIVRKFIGVSNQFLHGKVDIVHFMVEISSILSQLTKIAYSAAGGCSAGHKKLHLDKSFTLMGEHEEQNGGNSPISETSKSDGSEGGASRVVPADESHIASKNGPAFVDVSKIEEELRKVRSEKVALESHMRAEFGRFAVIEEELSKLRKDKVELENNLEEAKEMLEHMKAQLGDAERLVVNLRLQLKSAEESSNLADEQLSDMAATKRELQSQLRASEIELDQLRDKVETMRKEILEQRQWNNDLEVRCHDLQQQLQDAIESNYSQQTAADEDARTSKEREIAVAAEKLAECQQTILVLGKQLKALASPVDSMEISPKSLADHGRDLSGKDQFQSQQESSEKETDKARNSAHAFEQEEDSSVGQKRHGRDRKFRKDLSWNPQYSNISDLLDSELATLSKRGHGSGRTMLDLFGDKTPVHDDYIEAVAQMPSSPETEPMSPPKSVKPTPRKKKSPRSFVGIDLSKSMNDAGSPVPSEKHGSGFSRFFSRNKSSQ